MDDTDICLKMTGVSKRFGATVALQDVQLTLKKGQVHALVGENGAGKSTLMKILCGVLHPDSGAVELLGEPFLPVSPLHARQNGIAMIYQELSLVPHLSVEENIFLGMEPTRKGFIEWKVLHCKTRQALEVLGHEDIDPKTTVSYLSIGLQQVVEIARAIAIGCKILVFDEPTSSLANEDVRKLFKVINRLKNSGHGVIYISHFIEEIREIADQYTVLRDGCVCGSGPVEDITDSQLVSLMVGREVKDLYPRSRRTCGDIAMSVQQLRIKEKDITADFKLHYGEVLGIAGLVGSGRSEMIRAIFGLSSFQSGQITIGHISGTSQLSDRWHEGIGFLSENRKEEGLALSLSIVDNVTLPVLDRYSWAGFVLPSRQRKEIQYWVEKLEIKCTGPNQTVNSLSGGNQQKVALARLLEADVDVLILDEPTRGIDVGSKALFYKVIDRLVAGDPDRGIRPKAIVMISSYLPELLGVCDRVAVMCKGKLNPARPVSDLSEHQIMEEAIGVK